MLMLRDVPAPVSLPRQTDLAALFKAVRDMRCVSVVGVSNLGKSALLRSMTDPEVQRDHLGAEANGYLFIYVDFNQMIEMTEQAFYELMLRCSLEALRAHSDAVEILRQVQAAYDGLVAPGSNFEVPLRFAQALAVIGEQLPERVVFLLDELDGPLARIDGRVFLNLRAHKDRHPACLTYITATNSRLTQIRQDGDVGEFDELFAQHTYYLFPLNEDETAAFVAGYAAASGVTFSTDDLGFIRLWAGGHPGLLVAVCRILGGLTGSPVREASQDVIIHRRAAELFSHDLNVETECRKIWEDLTGVEQEALLAVVRSSGEQGLIDLDSVGAKHLILGNGPERHIFARAFADFLRRQQIARRPNRAGLSVDLESGEARLNGELVPTLTNLEYRLLLLLYGRLGKIVTKYEVVEAVWGEEYIDEVDDARIEKLVSRLRQKIEPDINNPRYLLTVRGRGYKLVQG
jgi:hypothetical protein